MTTFKPLVRHKLADQILDQLREAIANGQYRQGEPLPSERNLATVFGASRVAVREALVALQAQGLVERSHGRTARVLPEQADIWAEAEAIRLPGAPTERDVRNVRQMRVFLEVEMARNAAQTCSAQDAERLRNALEANRKAIADPRVFLQTDMALHTTIAGLSDNPLLAATACDLLNWLARFQTEAVHIEGSVMLSYREHARIVETIVARDPDAAAKAMFEHLSRTHMAYGRLHPPAASDEVPAGEARSESLK
jgi:DNA-binding FadR family transcriptional regulator